MDHAVTIEHRFRLGRGIYTAADWAAGENAKKPTCACGCGGRIRVLARHRWHGIPRYLRAHHPMMVSKEVAALRAAGGMTSRDAARVLGLGVTTLLRMEGLVFDKLPRRGQRGIRVLSEKVVSAVRDHLLR